MRIIVDDKPLEYEDGDSILIAMLRADQHPTGGGCLCLGGDCGHCVATVDGVSYVRTCQTQAKPGMVIHSDHQQGNYPPLPKQDRHTADIQARNLHCDVLVIGAGQSGQAAADEAYSADKEVIMLDTELGQEALGVYAGPLVVARTDDGMQHIHAKEVIVATGAAEIQAVAPGNQLAGIVTARAASKLALAGIDLGKVVAVGDAPVGVSAETITGTIVRFVDGGAGKLSGIVMADEAGNETSYTCDTVSLGLGLHPRDGLARQGHDMPQVYAVGDAAGESDIPPCPTAGIVCTCSGVSVDDLQYTWDSGFQELELVKRSTLCGTGTCQGGVCLPHLRSFLNDRGGELQKPFTARPMSKQVTMEEIAAGAHHHATARTALDAEHRKLGAQMERSGGWWRPWTYGNFNEEYWAVREAVSIMDVSTLGKMVIKGPDALKFLEYIYPTQVSTIRNGRARYVLMLNERGYVFDDGMIAKEADNHYYLTFTSGGASHAEMWMRDWAHGMGMDVNMMLMTQTLGAINVTGPLAGELLARAGLETAPRFLRHRDLEIAGIKCKVFRLSFTGELSFELHHPAEQSVQLWQSLMKLGKDLGIKPHGLEVLTALRLEKGHVIVNQDTDYDSTPRRIHHDWMVNLKKEEDFLGRHAVIRTNKIELDKMLVGFEMPGSSRNDAPKEGAVVWHKGEYAGYITSTTYSPALGKCVMLGWLYYMDGELPTEVDINGKTATRAETPFYDKEAARARA